MNEEDQQEPHLYQSDANDLNFEGLITEEVESVGPDALPRALQALLARDGK